MDPVRADEQVAGGVGALREPGEHPALDGGLGVHEPLAVLDADTDNELELLLRFLTEVTRRQQEAAATLAT